MENKINLQDLAQGISSANGSNPRDMYLFLQEVFAIIDEYISKEKLVKIKGFGTFKLIDVQERESINVSTGERIRIAGHGKVTFTPDTSLKDAVNKPFSEFETVILNEGVDISKMEEVGSPELPEVHETQELAETPETSVMAESPKQPEIQELELCPEVPVSDEAAEIPEVQEIPEDEILETENPEDIVIPETEASEKQEIYDETEPEIPVMPEPETPDPARVNQEIKVLNQHVEELNVATQHIEHQTIQQIAGTPAVDGTGVNISVSTIICAFVFVVMACVFCFYSGVKYATMHSAQPSNPLVEKPVEPTTPKPAAKQHIANPKPAVKPVPAKTEVKELGPEELAKNYTQVEDGEYWIVGELCTHEMKVGENLYRIAGKELGSQKLMKYIVVFNNFERPDVIPPGYAIKIPKLVKKNTPETVNQ